ncbi:transcriptional coactivator p15/PC4 family protein [Candidatus Pacearchaeota archaeon]|nr:transcriptional coactivator p15/PC4 family protein [Candidatus Pacearchaeota archaeon]
MVEKDIGKITKGEYQGTVTEIVVGVREYNGKVGVDIREFVTSDKYTGPTKKGLRIPAESFAKFKEMINSVQDADLVASEQPAEASSQEQGTLEAEAPSGNSPEGLPDY